jgi:hypothetical protein
MHVSGLQFTRQPRLPPFSFPLLTTGNFNAKGYTGQIIVLPTSISQLPKANGPAAGSIIGGNWSFTGSNGDVQNFKWQATAFKLNGKENGTLSINSLTNSTGAMTASPTAKIVLIGNSTSFKGNASINLNNKPTFTDVPVVVNLLNGKLVNLTISPAKTNNFASVV